MGWYGVRGGPLKKKDLRALDRVFSSLLAIIDLAMPFLYKARIYNGLEKRLNKLIVVISFKSFNIHSWKELKA